MTTLYMDYTFQLIFMGTTLLGMIAGAVGVFAVLRQHSLLGDAISHAAFPGIAWAFLLTYSKNPAVLMVGGTISGLLGAACVSAIMRWSKLKYDTALGIVLSVFFGIGLMLMTSIQKKSISNQVVLNKFLFGNAATMLPEDIYLISIVGLLIMITVLFCWKQFFLLSFDPLYMHVLGYKRIWWDRLLALLLVFTIVVGLQTVGVVLMSTMLIAPAAAARQWTHHLPTLVGIAAFFGGLSALFAALLSCSIERLPTGPVMVVIVSVHSIFFTVMCTRSRTFMAAFKTSSPMNMIQLELLAIAIMAALSCALPGIFLVLRGVALMSDAISHAILLGIIVMFLMVQDLSSPWLLFGAAAAGLLTVACTELLISTERIKKDTAIGLVFPLFFSIGIILITWYARDVHLDSDMVLLGDIALAPFHRFYSAGIDLGPSALWQLGGIFIFNLFMIILCFKELAIATFDPQYAAVIGFSPGIAHYLIMTLTSITAVAAFDIVGAIVVVALMIVPAATAYLLTRQLKQMMVLTLALSMGASIGGYMCAYLLDVSIAGSIAFVAGLLFLGALLFQPEMMKAT